MRDPIWVIAKSLPRNILKKTASVGPEILQLDVCTLTVGTGRKKTNSNSRNDTRGIPTDFHSPGGKLLPE